MQATIFMRSIPYAVDFLQRFVLFILLSKCSMQLFPGRLEGLLLEAKGAWAEAEKAYERLLEDNPLDQVQSSSILF